MGGKEGREARGAWLTGCRCFGATSSWTSPLLRVCISPLCSAELAFEVVTLSGDVLLTGSVLGIAMGSAFW